MEWAEIKTLGADKLAEELARLRAEQHALRLQAHSRSLKQVHKLKANRRSVSQILTSLAQRSAAN